MGDLLASYANWVDKIGPNYPIPLPSQKNVPADASKGIPDTFEAAVSDNAPITDLSTASTRLALAGAASGSTNGQLLTELKGLYVLGVSHQAVRLRLAKKLDEPTANLPFRWPLATTEAAYQEIAGVTDSRTLAIKELFDTHVKGMIPKDGEEESSVLFVCEDVMTCYHLAVRYAKARFLTPASDLDADDIASKRGVYVSTKDYAEHTKGNERPLLNCAFFLPKEEALEWGVMNAAEDEEDANRTLPLYPETVKVCYTPTDSCAYVLQLGSDAHVLPTGQWDIIPCSPARRCLDFDTQLHRALDQIYRSNGVLASFKALPTQLWGFTATNPGGLKPKEAYGIYLGVGASVRKLNVWPAVAPLRVVTSHKKVKLNDILHTYVFFVLEVAWSTDKDADAKKIAIVNPMAQAYYRQYLLALYGAATAPLRVPGYPIPSPRETLKNDSQHELYYTHAMIIGGGEHPQNDLWFPRETIQKTRPTQLATFVRK